MPDGPRLSSTLALPEDFATTRAAIVAMSGGGKTYTAAVLAEELVAAGQPFYALDPTGAWWGLRASANGRKAGLPVVVIGGEHGDIPLDPAGGAAVADLLVDFPSFYVIDMSGLDTRGAEVRFATAFLERLYRRKNKQRSPLHGFWDEADLFAPQRSGPDEARMLGAAESVVRRGRIRGLGTTMITQRPAVLNKNVLSQVKVLIALSLSDPRDRTAIKEWLDGTPDAERRREVLDSLAGLDLGEAWIYAPAARPVVYERGVVRERRTFNSSADGAGETEQVHLADVDVAALRDRMAATIEKAKADDPAELRKRVRDLERQLAARPAEPETVEVEVIREVTVEVEILTDDDRDDMRRLVTHLGEMLARVPEQGAEPAAPKTSVPRPTPRPANAPARSPARNGASSPGGTPGAGSPSVDAGARENLDGVITTPRQRVLDALAWFATLGIEAPTRAALAPLAGSKATSGGFKNNLSALRTAGLIDYPQSNCVQLTDTGGSAADWPVRAGTSEDLQQAVLATLTAPRQRILNVLLDAYPNMVSREDLAAAVDAPHTSGGFKNNLSAMRTQGVLDYPQQGMVVAADLLFLR